MLDFGWPELFLIIAVAVIVIGPNEIPALMVGLGRIVRRLQYVRFAVSQQFEDMMRDADMDNIRHSVNFEAPEDLETDEADADAQIAAIADEAPAAKQKQMSNEEREGHA